MDPVTSALSAPDSAQVVSRFALAPPRGFLLPAILLLLAEEPGYGYSLCKSLKEFRYGPVDRPSVYRALAQLETDGLVVSLSRGPEGGNARQHVYGVTPLGEDVLRSWIGVIDAERACLDHVIARYSATRSGHGIVAAIDGWAAPEAPALAGSGSDDARHRVTVLHEWSRAADEGFGADDLDDEIEVTAHETWARCRLRVVPERSVVLIEARSSVGPISFGAINLVGWIDADVRGSEIRVGPQTAAHLEIGVDGLRSGNSLYDGELLRRIDARLHPTAVLELRECSGADGGDRYRLAGELTMHGVTRSLQGTVDVDVRADRGLLVTGDHVVDIRDFRIESPSLLMLRIYPDVRVRLHLEAECVR